MKVCKRIEGEDVGDTSRAGTLFGPTLLRAAPRRGGTLRQIRIARFSWPVGRNFVHHGQFITAIIILRVPLPHLSRQFTRNSRSTVASLYLK